MPGKRDDPDLTQKSDEVIGSPFMIEHFVIDGGSTDDSAAVIEREKRIAKSDQRALRGAVDSLVSTC